MKCSNCYNEYQGNFCPNCGTKTTQTSVPQRSFSEYHPPKQKTSILKILLVCFGGLVSLFVFIIIIGISNYDKTSTVQVSVVEKVVDTPPAAIEIAATDLIKAYSENEVNADNLYRSKLLTVTGEVEDISKNIIDQPYITLKSKLGDFRSVQCFFKNEEELKKVAELKKGQQLTLMGTCDGKDFNVKLINCVIQ